MGRLPATTYLSQLHFISHRLNVDEYFQSLINLSVYIFGNKERNRNNWVFNSQAKLTLHKSGFHLQLIATASQMTPMTFNGV